jgi:hypothetical protein
MNKTHVSPSEQDVRIGDRGGDQYDSMVCVGYQTSSKMPGMPYTLHGVFWIDCEEGSAWHYSDNMEPVPTDVDITPIFVDPVSFDDWLHESSEP